MKSMNQIRKGKADNKREGQNILNLFYYGYNIMHIFKIQKNLKHKV